MGALIRKHMAAIDSDEKLGQDVEIDEIYIGGKDKNSGPRGDKVIVVGLVERGGDDALVKVVPDMKGPTIKKFVAGNVAEGAEIHADMHVSYDQLGKQGCDLKRIKKALKKFVGPEGQTTNAVENFWRHLKQSIEGTHISVSPKYLESYAKEFEYRFNRRTTPEVMLGELLSRFPDLGA